MNLRGHRAVGALAILIVWGMLGYMIFQDPSKGAEKLGRVWLTSFFTFALRGVAARVVAKSDLPEEGEAPTVARAGDGLSREAKDLLDGIQIHALDQFSKWCVCKPSYYEILGDYGGMLESIRVKMYGGIW